MTNFHSTGRLHRAAAAILAAALTLAGLAAAVAPKAVAATSAAIVNAAGCTTHNLWRNDDGSTAKVTLPFSLNFYNHVYTAAYLNNNGNITFQQAMSTFTPFTINASTPPIIAPFFADVDTRNPLSNVMTYGTISFNGHTAFCVQWEHVGYYSQKINKWNTFQLLLVNTSQQGDFDIVFNYGTIQWETGDASGGSNGLGGTPAGAGYSNGDGNSAHFVQLPGSLQSGAFLDGNTSTGLASHSNSGVTGRYVYHIASGITVTASQACAPYYFISVAGSGEHPASDTDLNASPETRAVYDAYVAKAPSAAANTVFYQVPYTAAATSVIWNGGHVSSGIAEYLASIFDGQNKLFGYMLSVDTKCATQHKTPVFFIVGYSQGALIIHDLLQFWPLHSEIRYVGLIADPAAVQGRMQRVEWGTSNPASEYGICDTLKGFLFGSDPCPTSDADILPVYVPVTDSLCDKGDIVCDASTLGPLPAFLIRASGGTALHTSYPVRDPDALTNMGKSLATINHLT